jgi:hypothetical protein
MTHIRYTPTLSEGRQRRLVTNDLVELVDGETIIDISSIVQKITIENEAGSVSTISLRIIDWELV